tara:strand:- start:17842 stop:18537 length:696 start_codon:yes stop_codon:yes gene_type:complete
MITDWMLSNNIISFRLFSVDGVSGLPNGWQLPEEFKLDGAVFYTGDIMYVFTDDIHKILINSKEALVSDMSKLQEWLDYNKGATLVGYHSEKFDIPLLARDYNIEFKHIDLADILFDSSKNHYNTYGRRYDIHSLSEWNNNSQSILPDMSFMMKPIQRLSEWKRGRSRNVLRTIALETQLIAQLYSKILIHEEIKILDERTDRLVTISCDNVRDVLDTNIKIINEKAIEEE